MPAAANNIPATPAKITLTVQGCAERAQDYLASAEVRAKAGTWENVAAASHLARAYVEMGQLLLHLDTNNAVWMRDGG